MLLHPDIDPVALRLGPLEIRWYGLAYLTGFLAGWFLGRRRAARPGSGWTPVMVDDLVSWCVLGLVLGARLGYVVFYDPLVYLHDPLAIVQVWQGGMSFHGGLVGLCLVCWLYGRRHRKTFLDVADFLVPMGPLGLLAGRLANFVNGELWGAPTALPWGMVFADPRAGGLPRHPSQLYEGLLEGLVLFVVVWVYSSRPRPRGAVSGLFLLLYGTFRFLVEFVRQPDPQLGYLAWGWLTMGQVLCLPMLAVGLFLLLGFGRRA